jgi:ubiquinone/menaquinone biosynthesis C-methylase UbiE
VFNNWISIPELVDLFRRVRGDPELASKIRSRLLPGRRRRIRAAWAHIDRPPILWSSIPAVRERINRIITGSPGLEYREYLCDKYWAGREDLEALSLGCGSGTRELRWAETGRFARIDACDLSERRIRYAVAAAESSPCGGVVRYSVGNAVSMEFPDDRYDVVFTEGSLHHFSPMEGTLRRISNTLKPGGVFVACEYVGPTRFQWTDRQLQAVNELLAIFPDRFKTHWHSRYVQSRLIRPSRLRMVLSDPSEAVESGAILPLVKRMFEPLETQGFGGTVLAPLFGGIAHHFVTPDEEGRRLLEQSFALEDRLLEDGEIGDDYALLVCRKRPAPR